MELEPRSGEVVRRFPVYTGEGTAALSVDPAGEAVYLSRAATACRAELVRIPLDGGEEEILGHGAWPAVSPDGGRLAFLRGEHCSGQDSVLWLRDLNTGEEWPVPEGEEPGLFGPPAWSPDGRSLAVASGSADPETAAQVSAAVILLMDVDSDNEITALGPWTLPWAAPAWAGSDLLVVELCCDVIDGYPDEDSSRVLAVDPQTGEVRRTILETAGLVTSLETDAAGKQALIVATTGEPGGSQRDQLLVLDLASGATRPLRMGISTASW